MSKPFQIGQGNTPRLIDTLSDENGVVDVSGMTVAFVLQGGGGVNFTRTGGIEDGPSGKVNYQFVAEDSAAPGDYLAQWVVTAGAVTRTFPGEGYIQFTVQPALPLAQAAAFSRLSDLFPDVRAVCGDHRARRYQDSAIETVMRVNLRAGRVPGYALGPDNRSIAPALPNTDVTAYVLLVYHTAKILLTPNVKSSSYRTRALSERFGDQRDFLVELENVLYEVENGSQTYSNVHGMRSWLWALLGLTDNSALLIPQNFFFSPTIYL